MRLDQPGGFTIYIFFNWQTLAFSATLPILLELEETMKSQENTDDWIIIPYPGNQGPSNGLANRIVLWNQQIQPDRPTRILAIFAVDDF